MIYCQKMSVIACNIENFFIVMELDYWTNNQCVAKNIELNILFMVVFVEVTST